MPVQILVIEDDPDVRDTVHSALETLFPDARITEMADGSRFLEIFDRLHEWNLIVMDVMLPAISGIDICRQIRADPRGARVPVLAMTGYDTSEMERKVREAGATEYLTKPFDMPDFQSMVRRMMEKRA